MSAAFVLCWAVFCFGPWQTVRAAETLTLAPNNDLACL